MKDINKVILIGRITADCKFGYLNSGSAKADFSIAVNDSKKQGDSWVDDTSFFNITVWGKSAENLKDYFKKGQMICVEGKLKQDRWEKDGQKFSAIKLITENIQLLGGNRNSNANVVKTEAYTPSENNTESNNVDYSDFPEDIPF